MKNNFKKILFFAVLIFTCCFLSRKVAFADNYRPIITQAEIVNGEAKITWAEFEKCSLYALYLKDADGNVTLIHNRITSNSYTVSGFRDGESYGFVVKGYSKAGWSDYSMTYWTKALVVAKEPQNVDVRPEDGRVLVSWDASYGANVYALFLKRSDGTVSLIDNRIHDTMYVVNGLVNEERYGFVVKAYAGHKWSTWSKVIWATPTEHYFTGYPSEDSWWFK